MSDLRADMISAVEAVTGVKAYSVRIPPSAEMPAIRQMITGGYRHNDSTFTDSNIREYRLSLTVCGKTPKEAYTIEKALIDAFDGKKLTINDSKIMSMHHANSIELHNYEQNLYEVTVDFKIKLQK